MIIVADDNMPLVEQFFAPLGTVRRLPGRSMQAEALADADILLVRSITKVNAELLRHASSLRFIGTATIGTDHLDIAEIERRDIAWSNAAGCNAQSVVEYVLSCLFLEAERRQVPLSQLRVGVVGVGQIGSRLVHALTALQVTVVQCDPPRFAQDPTFAHTPLPQLLADVDIVSLHVPLVRQGADSTFHLIDRSLLATLPASVTIINACRGEVIDNQALYDEQHAGGGRVLYLDVWEGEPEPLRGLVPYCQIATAHIAGHSIEGKARGTEMLYQQVCRLLGQPITASLANFLPTPAISAVTLTEQFNAAEVPGLCRLLYDVRRDDQLFRQHLDGLGFDWLRKNYPARREFSALTLQGQVPFSLHQLGFLTPFTQD